MSALDGWVDVCRTGTFRDSRHRDVEVTESLLDGIVAAHPAQDPVPVVIGHPAQDAPAYGWVEAVRRTGDRLQARFRDLAPAFRAAVEAGSYRGRSIAMAGGKLRHIGFLGGRAPAVPGLAPTHFAAGAETVIAFAAAPDMTLAGAWSPRDAMRSMALSMARIMRGLRERIIADQTIEAADEAIPSWDIDHLQAMADELGETAGDVAYATPEEDASVTGTATNPTPTPDAAALAARSAELDAREARLNAGEAAARAAQNLRAADTALDAHVAAGRVLPGERAPLAALLASLPADETTIAFAAPEGAGEVQERPRAVLERFLGALPRRVDYTELAGGALPPAPDARPGGEDSTGIAAEARVLMSAAAERGETLTAIQAVDQVRAKRGLATGGTAR